MRQQSMRQHTAEQQTRCVQRDVKSPKLSKEPSASQYGSVWSVDKLKQRQNQVENQHQDSALLSPNRFYNPYPLESFQFSIQQSDQYPLNSAKKQFNLAYSLEPVENIDSAVKNHKKDILLKPTFAEFHIALGRHYHQLKQIKLAIVCYFKAQKLNPSFSLDKELADCYKRMGMMQDAVICYKKAIELNLNNVQAFIGLGQCYINEGVQCLKKAVMLNPNHKQAIGQLGCLFFQANQTQKALTCFQKVLEMDQTNIRALNNMGLILIELGSSQEAQKNFYKSIDQKGYKVEALNNLGILQVKNGRTMQGFQLFKKALSLRPNQYVLNNLGNLLLNMGKWREARKCFEKALNINSSLYVSIHNLAISFINSNQKQKTLDYLTLLLQKQIQFQELFCNLGNILSENGQEEKAQEYFEKAFEMNPNYDFVYHSMGITLHDLGQFYCALKFLRKALQINPNNQFFLAGLGATLTALNKNEQALQCNSKALQINPNFVEMLRNSGRILCNLRRYRLAIEAFEKAIQFENRDYQSLFCMAICFVNLNQKQEALKYLKKVYTLLPNQYDLFITLGRFYLQIKQNVEAIRCFGNAIRIHSKSHQAYQYLAKIYYSMGRTHQTFYFFKMSIELKPEISFEQGLESVVFQEYNKELISMKRQFSEVSQNSRGLAFPQAKEIDLYYKTLLFGDFSELSVQLLSEPVLKNTGTNSKAKVSKYKKKKTQFSYQYVSSNHMKRGREDQVKPSISLQKKQLTQQHVLLILTSQIMDTIGEITRLLQTYNSEDIYGSQAQLIEKMIKRKRKQLFFKLKTAQFIKNNLKVLIRNSTTLYNFLLFLTNLYGDNQLEAKNDQTKRDVSDQIKTQSIISSFSDQNSRISHFQQQMNSQSSFKLIQHKVKNELSSKRIENDSHLSNLRSQYSKIMSDYSEKSSAFQNQTLICGQTRNPSLNSSQNEQKQYFIKQVRLQDVKMLDGIHQYGQNLQKSDVLRQLMFKNHFQLIRELSKRRHKLAFVAKHYLDYQKGHRNRRIQLTQFELKMQKGLTQFIPQEAFKYKYISLLWNKGLQQVLLWMRCFISAIVELQQIGIFHPDLQFRNTILVDGSQHQNFNHKYVVIDFDYAFKVRRQSKESAFENTLEFFRQWLTGDQQLRKKGGLLILLFRQIKKLRLIDAYARRIYENIFKIEQSDDSLQQKVQSLVLQQRYYMLFYHRFQAEILFSDLFRYKDKFMQLSQELSSKLLRVSIDDFEQNLQDYKNLLQFIQHAIKDTNYQQNLTGYQLTY